MMPAFPLDLSVASFLTRRTLFICLHEEIDLPPEEAFQILLQTGVLSKSRVGH
ncbi:hypothetical protein BH20ACT11_BH20ACT11_00340 [soil metagenome]|jgi:hypothetical protein